MKRYRCRTDPVAVRRHRRKAPTEDAAESAPARQTHLHGRRKRKVCVQGECTRTECKRKVHQESDTPARIARKYACSVSEPARQACTECAVGKVHLPGKRIFTEDAIGRGPARQARLHGICRRKSTRGNLMYRGHSFEKPVRVAGCNWYAVLIAGSLQCLSYSAAVAFMQLFCRKRGKSKKRL